MSKAKQEVIELENEQGELIDSFNSINELKESIDGLSEDMLSKLFPYMLLNGDRVSITFDGAIVS